MSKLLKRVFVAEGVYSELQKREPAVSFAFGKIFALTTVVTRKKGISFP